jgi:hypothetical protein
MAGLGSAGVLRGARITNVFCSPLVSLYDLAAKAVDGNVVQLSSAIPSTPVTLNGVVKAASTADGLSGFPAGTAGAAVVAFDRR